VEIVENKFEHPNRFARKYSRVGKSKIVHMLKFYKCK